MIKPGLVLNMFFAAKPDEERQVVVKALYGNDVWVQYLDNGNNEVIDGALVRFRAVQKEPDYTPEHDFICLNPEYSPEEGDKWIMWAAELGQWFIVDDPTNPLQEAVDDSIPYSSMPEHPTLQ